MQKTGIPGCGGFLVLAELAAPPSLGEHLQGDAAVAPVIPQECISPVPAHP